MASLAGIGVSWYTALENGSAQGVSEATLHAIADVLRLSDGERHYLLALGRGSDGAGDALPARLLMEAVQGIAFPAYVINAAWDILECNAAFERVWNVDRRELPFNAVERLFFDARGRALHGEHFVSNITPVIAMVRSGLGRHPHMKTLERVRDGFAAETALLEIWQQYRVDAPHMHYSAQIDSPLGPYRYHTLDLAVPDATHGVVVQVPDEDTRRRLFPHVRGMAQ